MTVNKKKRSKKSRLPLLALSFFVFLLLSIFGGYFALMYAGKQMIDPQKLEDIKTEPSVIYDKNGKEVGTLYVAETRDYKSLNDIPRNVINAFVAVEDRRFFEHNGVDLFRIGGAILKDIKLGTMAEGGSTITQQLAKNVFLTREKTFWRKTKEMSIAINLEQKYSKDEIMEMYLNKIYLGHGVAGVEAASQLYFGKSVSDLQVHEAAMLAAIPKAPSTYSPFAKPEKAKERRDTILRLMNEQGYITLEEKEAAQEQPLPTVRNQVEAGIKPGYEAYFDYVVQEAEEKYGITEEMLYRGGWEIHTALDTKVQDAMIRQFQESGNFPKNGSSRQVEGGMVVLDPYKGGIAGIMGGRNYVHKGFSHATDMRRQPGSAFKPIAVYAPALESGKWNINDSLSNKLQSFNGYEPRNANGRYSEWVSMRDAVAHSYNVPAVWLLKEIGVTEGIKAAEKFGIPLDKEKDRNLAIALGGLSKGTSPLEIAQAYTAFVNGGSMSHAYVIETIKEPRLGFEKAVQPKHTQVISAQTAWDVHQLLEGVVEYGTGKNARIKGFPVAGKTGTTQSTVDGADKDAWFVGYTPEYVSAVWMGFDKEDKEHVMRKVSGMPAKMFSRVLSEGLKGVKTKGFTRPDGVKEIARTPEMTAPKLEANLTLDNDKLKVVLIWVGNEELNVSYDLYRFVDSPENKELVASDLTDTTAVDTLTSPTMYKYILIPKDADGKEGPPSNIAEINTKQLERLLEDAENHDDLNEHVPIEEELPIPEDVGDQPALPQEQNPDGNQGGAANEQTPPPQQPPMQDGTNPGQGTGEPPADLAPPDGTSNGTTGQ